MVWWLVPQKQRVKSLNSILYASDKDVAKKDAESNISSSLSLASITQQLLG